MCSRIRASSASRSARLPAPAARRPVWGSSLVLRNCAVRACALVGSGHCAPERRLVRVIATSTVARSALHIVPIVFLTRGPSRSRERTSAWIRGGVSQQLVWPQAHAELSAHAERTTCGPSPHSSPARTSCRHRPTTAATLGRRPAPARRCGPRRGSTAIPVSGVQCTTPEKVACDRQP
jgi:hypothetical protein